jgi:hypothetical protein
MMWLRPSSRNAHVVAKSAPGGGIGYWSIPAMGVTLFRRKEGKELYATWRVSRHVLGLVHCAFPVHRVPTLPLIEGLLDLLYSAHYATETRQELR